MSKIQFKNVNDSKWQNLECDGENYSQMTLEAAKREVQDREWTAFFQNSGIVYRIVKS